MKPITVTKLSAAAEPFPYRKTSLPTGNSNVAAPPFPTPLPYHQPPLHHQPHNPVFGYYYYPDNYALNNMQESGYGHWNHAPQWPQYQAPQWPQYHAPQWPQYHQLGPGGNIHMQHGVGCRPGPRLSPQFYYSPPATLTMVDQGLPMTGPHPTQFDLNSRARMSPSDLRKSVVKQIEYYFSDENMKNDLHLISLMDDQGWVPISTIADFKRVKIMCVDIAFILDSLMRDSVSVEVKGDMIRRRDEWSKWIPASADSVLTSKPQTQPTQLLGSYVNAPQKNVELSSDENNLMEHLLSNTEHGIGSVKVDGGSLVFTAC